METHKSARELKAEIQNNTATLYPTRTSTSTHPEEDQETTLIQRLRATGATWTTIATHLNTHVPQTPSSSPWTPTSVYTHFLLTTTPTAHPAHPLGFTTQDHAHLRHASASRSRAGAKRVRNYSQANELAGNVRQEGERSEQAAELRSHGMTEVLVRAVGVVNEGFWALVADEMERRTARLYAAEELEGRWFNI